MASNNHQYGRQSPNGSWDAIVVGGGITGCSIAWRLSQAGRNVLLLEQRDICSGASGRNGGVTGEGSAMYAEAGQAVYALTSANLRLLTRLSEELQVDFQFRQRGSLEVATTSEEWEHLQHSTTVQRDSGLNVELLDAHEARKLVPVLNQNIAGAKLARGNGHLWPFALVHGMATAAIKQGVVVQTGTPVLSLLRRGGNVVGVRTPAESIEAEHVILATNAYTPLLLEELPKGAIVPARGQILVTQPMPPMLPMPFGTNFDKEYGRQVPGGPILCGGYRRLDVDEGLGHYEERVTLPVLSGIAKCLTGLFPSLAQVQVIRSWAGIMGFTADGVPLIGTLDDTPGLIVAAGFNGGGFSWGPIVGKVITAMLTGQPVEYDLTPFRPSRFGEQGTAWNNPFTAGEKSRTRAAAAQA